jgi:hypothetical protein
MTRLLIAAILLTCTSCDDSESVASAPGRKGSVLPFEMPLELPTKGESGVDEDKRKLDKSPAPQQVKNVEELVEWYNNHRGGVGGQFEAEGRGGKVLVMWAPRKDNELETLTSTYVQPDQLSEFHFCSEQPIQSLDYGDGVMRHFGEVRYIEENGAVAYYLLPGVIYSHGMILHETADAIIKEALPSR